MSGTKRISALTELASNTVAGEDIVAVVDMSQASVTDKTKHTKVSSLLGAAASDGKPKVSFKTVAAFIADNNSVVGYSGSGAKFELAEGDIFEAGGFRYSVRATGASDNHVASAGGFKADVADPFVTPEHLGDIGGGSDDQTELASFFAIAATGFRAEAHGTYRLSSRITVTATGHMNMNFSGATFTCVASSQQADMVYIEADNCNLFMEHAGKWDGDDLAVKLLQIRNSATTGARPDIYIKGFEGINAKSTVAVPSSVSSALVIFGAWETVKLVDPKVENVSREAGAGSDSQGIIISYLSAPTRNPKSVIVCNPYIVNVTTEDDVTTAAAIDCDGMVIFQEDEADGTECIVNGGLYKNCIGRDVKANAPYARIINPTSARDVPGKYDGAIHYAFQKGDGVLENAAFIFDGDAHQQGTTLVSFYTAQDRQSTRGQKIVNGITVLDSSDGADTIFSAIDLSVANGLSADYGTNFTSIRDVIIKGKSVDHLCDLRNFGGSTGTGDLEISNVRADIGVAIGFSDSTLPNLSARVQNFINTSGTDVPVLYRSGGSSLANSWGRWYGDFSNQGIVRNLGANTASPGLTPISAQGTQNNLAYFGGAIPLFQDATMPDTEHLTFTIGEPAGAFILVLRYISQIVVLQTLSGSASFTTIGASVNTSFMEVDNTGAEPTTANRFRVWKTGSGTILNLKNASGSARMVSASVIC